MLAQTGLAVFNPSSRLGDHRQGIGQLKTGKVQGAIHIVIVIIGQHLAILGLAGLDGHIQRHSIPTPSTVFFSGRLLVASYSFLASFSTVHSLEA